MSKALDPGGGRSYIEIMSQADPLADIRYISLNALEPRSIGEFTLDPEIRLPVEIPAGSRDQAPSSISWEAIISAMLKLLAYRPDHPHAGYYRAFILAAKPDIKEEFTQAGIIKSRQGQLDLASEIFRALAGVFPDCGTTRTNLALVYEEKARQLQERGAGREAEAQLELAFQEYKSAVACEPELAAAHLNFGHFYLRRRNLKLAREQFEEFLTLNRDPEAAAEVQALRQDIDALNRVELGCAEAFDDIRLGREALAIDRLLPMAREHAGVWNIWFLLGWAQRRLARYAEAKESLQRALRLQPANSDALNELAICYMELGDFKHSRQRLQEALQIEPDNTKLLSNLGVLSLKMGHRDQAERCFSQVLDLDPADPLARHYLETL